MKSNDTEALNLTWYIVLYIFCFTLVLVLAIGITRGQYYWILGALLGIVLTVTVT